MKNRPALLLIVSIITLGLEAGFSQNLIVNSDFSQDTAAPIGLPDFFRPRYPQFHSVDTYTGPDAGSHGMCARFDGPTTAATAYFYSNYDSAGVQTNFPSGESGATYEASVECKVEPGFLPDNTAKPDGVMLQLFLSDRNGVIIGNTQSEWTLSETWTTLKITAKVTGRVAQVSAGVTFHGEGTAWADNLKLRPIVTPLMKNGQFEKDDATPLDKPDHYLPRSTTLSAHHVEDSLDYTYLGEAAAKFDASGSSDQACYFYGPYDSTGTTHDRIPVHPGDSYKISAFGRTSSAFTGTGLNVSLLFWDNNSFVSRVDSIKESTNGLWEKFAVDGVTVPQSANKMSYSVEYRGLDEAWFDQLEVLPDNLIINSSAETDSDLNYLPDFWLPRSGPYLSYHQLDSAGGSASPQAMLIDNDSGTTQAGYFYGPATQASTALNADAIRVKPGETYTLSADAKVANDFVGSGVRVSLIFWSDAAGTSGSYHSRVDSAWHNPATFTELSVDADVPEGADRMTYSVEYKGQNAAWFDKVDLRVSTVDWHLAPVPYDSWDPLPFTAPTPATETAVVNRFIVQHNTYEANYQSNGNPPGTWGVGYGAQANNRPLVRASANSAMAYIGALRSGSFTQNHAALEIDFEDRAFDGLEWLLTQQEANGSFPWWWTDPPITGGGSEVYETGLAGQALMQGYTFFNDSRFLDAANDACDYLLGVHPQANANFNAFAILALVENYGETGTQAYIGKALEFLDVMVTFQLESGMWADSHNQLIYYHGIITASMARTLEALPAGHPKTDAIVHYLTRAVNHMRHSQNANGTLVVHFSNPGYSNYSTHNTMSTSVIHSLPGIGPLNDSMAALSVGSLHMSIDYTQGFSLNALATLLEHYY